MAIVIRGKDVKVEIPDEDLKLIQSAADRPKEEAKEALDLYKMEYETCTQRYNNLYTAAWTNFSYMALFAGGILTFGGSRFIVPLTAFLACLPLLFWWIATFEPLNKYGDQVLNDLDDIENALNAHCFPRKSVLPVRSNRDKETSTPLDYANKGLTHFHDFAKRDTGQSAVPRVRTVVRITGGILLVTAIYFGCKTVQLHLAGQALTVPQPTPAVPNAATAGGYENRA